MDFINDTFAIEIVEYDEWQFRSRKNNFFELVYILEGNGFHSVNDEDYPYNKNGIFLLPIAKCHQYKIEKTTRFLFIRFLGTYFSNNKNSQIDYSNWFSRLYFIMGNHFHLSGEVVDSLEDKEQLKHLLDVIVYEYTHKDICSAFIIQNILVSVLAIICRNVQQRSWGERKFIDEKLVDLLNFISFNILDSNKITVAYLAEKFHISDTYFSEYFKRNTNERFQDFVLKSKLRIAKSRAQYTDNPIQEIALDLGFTDSSHLNRMMKKHLGKGMSSFRKEFE